jgi:uncharacterized protein (TIGR04255 family)
LSDVRFERPPVNHVHLTLHFELTSDLHVSHLSSLREGWRDRYPETRERPPTPRDDSDFVRYMGRHSVWPFPYLAFHAADRAIVIEGTKFALTWTFADNAQIYPTYANLRSELAERFNEFADVVAREVDERPRLTAAECQYYNALPGESLARVIGYVLTDGKVDLGPDSDRSDVDYQGFRRHVGASPENQMVEVLVGVDTSTDEPEPVELFIEATHYVDDEEVPLAGIDVAHDVLIDTFVNCTRPDQHERWGRVAQR